MKYAKILGLLAVAAAALMAFAGTASATTLTSPTGSGTTPTVHSVSLGNHVKIVTPLGTVMCSWTWETNIQKHGKGITTEGLISDLTFTGCTNSWHVTAINPGSFIAHWTSGYNGTFTFAGMKIDLTRLGVTCVYTFSGSGSSVGNITGGNPAVFTVEAAIPVDTTESSSLCGTSAAKWEGLAESTSALYLDQ